HRGRDLAREKLPGQIGFAARQQDVIQDLGMRQQARGSKLAAADRDPQWREQAAPAPIATLSAVERHPFNPDAAEPAGENLDKQPGLADACRAENERDSASPLLDAVEEVVQLGGLPVPA